MLKFYYNVFFISILSGSMMLMDFSMKGIGWQQASAQANKSQSAPPVASTTTEILKTGVDDTSDIFGTLAMTAVGTLASRMYKYKMTTDIMLAAAGGALFIGGEVLAFASLDSKLKEIESQITRDKNGNLNNEQIRHLERLKQSYEEALKTAGAKKKLQLAAAAAFAAAGIAAATATAAEATALSSCTSGITSAAAGLGAICAGVPTPSVPACKAEVTACKSSLTAYGKSIMAYELSKQALGPSAGLMTKVSAEGSMAEAQLQSMMGTCPVFTKKAATSVKVACGPKLPLDKTNLSFTSIPMGVVTSIENLFPKHLNTENIFFSGKKISRKSFHQSSKLIFS